MADDPMPKGPSRLGRLLQAFPDFRTLSFWGFGALVVLAVVFYVAWGVAWGVWTDNGVYAVVITLLGFGLAGMWLVTPIPPVAEPETK